MRIVMILSTPIPPREGVGFYVWNLAKFLIMRGHCVQLITRGGPHYRSCEKIEDITVWRPPFLPLYPFHVHLHGLFISSLIRQLEPTTDVFHLHSPLVPVISTDRPVMLTFHSTVPLDTQLTPVVDLYTMLMRFQAPISYRLESANIKRAACINAISPWVAKDLQTYIDGHSKIEVMWNGVDSCFFSPEYHNTSNSNELLFVGRLAPEKGLIHLIKAFNIVIQRFPNIRLSIAGDGPLYGNISSLIRRYELNSYVRLIGHVSSRETIRSLYRQARCLILPSDHESLPGVLLEAMACGTPVIASRVGGIPDIISDGENGILVNPKAVDEIVEAICHLFENSSINKKLGQAARDTIEKRFAWSIIGEHYLNGYSGILNTVSQ